MHAVIQIWTFFSIVNEWGLSNCMRSDYFAFKTCFFCVFVTIVIDIF